MTTTPIPPLFALTAADHKRLSRQELDILELLRGGPKDALELEAATGSKRVAARIFSLRQAGHEIVSFRSARGVGGYRLKEIGK